MQPIDLAAAMERFEGDLPFFVELLREFIDGLPDRVRSIEDAVEAGDTAKLREIAHNLRGASGNLGADDLAGQAFAIEQMGAASEIRGAIPRLENLRLEIVRVEQFAEEIAGEVP